MAHIINSEHVRSSKIFIQSFRIPTILRQTIRRELTIRRQKKLKTFSAQNLNILDRMLQWSFNRAEKSLLEFQFIYYDFVN